MGTTEAKHPTALISYSHDSLEHERRVLDLCNQLRARGVDAMVDQFLSGAPSEGWPLWMERQIEGRDFTLMVCTEPYRRRFMEDETAGVGRGVVWEARILRNLLYEDSERHGRILPLLFESDDRPFIPTVFHGHFYDLSDENGFEKLLRHLLREPGAEAGALGSLGPQGSRWSAFERPWLVPDALRTRYFTGREQLLGQLHQQLKERHRAALSGLGGVGKTQTAIEYAVRHRADYPDGVFWTNAETTSGLNSGFVEIAKTLHLAAAASSVQEQIVRATIEWLNGTERWLLILDNVDDWRDVLPFVPLRGKGDILITSRESVFQQLGIARGLEVVDLDGDEAVKFLLVRTGRDDREEAAATGLADELGNLPLALEQAAAYIAETNVSFSDYLASFRRRRVSLLEKASGFMSRDTVAVTWEANFEAVESASPAAADILRISAFLAPDAIPFEVFYKGASALSWPIAEALSDPEDVLAMGDLLRPLTRYSLIRSDPNARTFGVHRLVQEIVRASIDESERRTLIERAIGAIDAAFPEVEFANWVRCDRLVPHVVALAKWIGEYDIALRSAGRILNQTGEALSARGRHANAQPLYEQALAIRELVLGPDHPDVARSLNRLAVAYVERRQYAEAEPLYERALAIVERAVGPDHPSVMTILNNLANANFEQGRYAKAQPMYERALAIRERTLGPDHPDVAVSLFNLANVLLIQRRYDDAESMSKRALAIRERALGPDHPDVARSLDNLGNLYYYRGRYADAEPLYRRSLAIAERAHGSVHPHVASALDGLASVFRKQGRYTEAQLMYERAVKIFESALGPDHPYVACSLFGLASTHKDQNQNEEAMPLFERVLAIRERKFQPDLPEPAEIRVIINTLRSAIEATPPSDTVE